MTILEVDKNRGWHKNGCVRIHSGSYEHEKAIFDEAFKKIREGHQIGTQVLMTNGRIVDLVDFTTNEMLEYETGKSYIKTEEKIKTVRI